VRSRATRVRRRGSWPSSGRPSGPARRTRWRRTATSSRSPPGRPARHRPTPSASPDRWRQCRTRTSSRRPPARPGRRPTARLQAPLGADTPAVHRRSRPQPRRVTRPRRSANRTFSPTLFREQYIGFGLEHRCQSVSSGFSANISAEIRTSARAKAVPELQKAISVGSSLPAGVNTDSRIVPSSINSRRAVLSSGR